MKPLKTTLEMRAEWRLRLYVHDYSFAMSALRIIENLLDDVDELVRRNAVLESVADSVLDAYEKIEEIAEVEDA